MNARRNRIDLHHHVLPPGPIAELAQRHIEWTGGAGVPEWNVDLALERMAQRGTAAAVASVQPQALWGGDVPAAIKWAREGNEFLARIIQDHPQRYGGFASLPLPDTAAALQEIEYALDVLKLDGVLMLTSQGGHYLGDPLFEEVSQELNRRNAVVVVHPNTVPPGADTLKLSLPYSMVEFTFDTTRTIANLLYSGTLARYPQVRYIMPHAGGAVPYLAWRIGLGAEMKPRLRERVPMGPLHYLRTSIFYDTALASSPFAMKALRQFAPASQIVFGTDYPMAPDAVIDTALADFEGEIANDPDDAFAIQRGNALRLFPRFAAAPQDVAVRDRIAVAGR
jgi:predicted TIM-barrel fold metal-dependent hydrolase